MTSDVAPPAPAPGARELPGFLAAFAFRNYRTLWLGAFLSSVGTWTQDVALAWLIHTRFGDPSYLGWRSFAAEAPLLTFMLVGGAMADRGNRRRVLLTSQFLQMGFAALLGVLYFLGWLGLMPILVIAVLTGLAQSQSAPTYQALLPTLVPPRHIPNAVALNSLQFNLSRAIGPALAGLLLTHGGTGACFAVNALSFLAVIVALSRIDIPPPAAPPQESLGRSLKAGLSHVASSPVLRMFTALGFVASFLAYPVITFLPVIASAVVGTGATGYSALLASYGIGAIAGAIRTAHRGSASGRGAGMLLALTAYGSCIVATVWSRHQVVSMALLFLAGLFSVSAFSVLNSLVQENAPDTLRGRVVSIYHLAFRGGMPIGSLVAGFFVKAFGVSLVVTVLGVCVVALALGVMRWGGRVARL